MKNKHWFDLAEYASLVGLGVGSVASVVSSQFLYATAPLSVLALLNLANRRRLDEAVEGRTAIALNELDQKTTQQVEQLSQQVQTLPTPEILAGLKKSLLIKDREILSQLSGQIEALQTELQRQVVPLQQLELGHLPEEVAQLRGQYKLLSEEADRLKLRLEKTALPETSAEQERAIAQMQANLEQLRADLQRLSDQTRPGLQRLKEEVDHINRKLNKLPPPFDATALQQEVGEMVRVVAELVPRRDWSVLLQEIQSLQQQQESLAIAGETLHRQVQDLHQQLQTRPGKANLTTLQNQITQLSQQVQALPPPFDPAILRRNLADLVKTVADLVPRQDFSSLVAQVRSLQQQQSSQAETEGQLRRDLQSLQQQLEQLSITASEVPPEFPFVLTVDAEASQMNGQPLPPAESWVPPAESWVPPDEAAHRFESAPVPAPSPNTAADFPSPVVAPNEIPDMITSGWVPYLESYLQGAFQQLRQRLQSFPADPELQPQVEAAFQYELQMLNQQWQTEGGEEHFEMIFDGMAVYRTPEAEHLTEGGVFTGLAVLEAALETAHSHLMLVLPWSVHHALEGALLDRLENLLQQGCRLDLGWCHVSEPTHPRFLTPISQRWHLQSNQQGELQDTLRRLLHLKRTYPQLLQFKIVGMRESFLVVDQQLAVVGINEALPELAMFPELGIKLQTTDLVVVQSLLRWFEHPAVADTDEIALWNRAITYYDLSDRPAALADLERILRCNPADVMAYNFRGVVRYDLKDYQGALADFTKALELSPHLTLAYCNRGFLHSERGDQLDAIADFNAALRLSPEFALAYFYRGVACQKFGELAVAIQNYDEAIRLAPNAAPAFYYRGMAHAWTEDHPKAIADLQRAAHLFDGERSIANAEKARAQLEKLWQAVGNQAPAIASKSDLASVSR